MAIMGRNRMMLALLALPLCSAFAPQQHTRTSSMTTTTFRLFLAEESSAAPAAVSALPFFANLEPATAEGTGAATVTTRLPLGTLFDASREYIFSTATNVRGYEWTFKEADELFADLTDVANNGATVATSSNGDVSPVVKQDYELSQVVLVPMEWDRAAFGLGQKYDVHDGQQRIVTLCLLFAALRESFRNSDGMQDMVEELTNMLNPPKVRKESVLRVELRRRDNDMLRRILLPELVAEENNDEATVEKVNLPPLDQRKNLSVANKRVLENYERLLSHVHDLTKDDRLALLDYMVEHVYLLVCVPETARIARNIVMAQGKGMDNEPIDDFKGLVCFRYVVYSLP
jgi:hypothetical protein